MVHPSSRPVLALLAALALASTIGCGSADDAQSAMLAGGATPAVPSLAGCIEGSIRECKIVTSVREGYTDCARGYQVCHSNEWGACTPPDENAAKVVGDDDAGPPADGGGSDAASSD